MRKIGLDFGTTNSALAIAEPGEESILASFQSEEGGNSTTFRSILFFSAEEKGPDKKSLAVAGPEAIGKYLAADGRGRLIQSLKSHLASQSFTHTTILGRIYKLDDLIAILVRRLREAAERKLGDLGTRVVVGRPVHFSGANNKEDDDLALSRLMSALEKAGFEHITFEFEPVAAAYQYEQKLDHDELVLIGDFGGGTSDFSLIRLGPQAKQKQDKRSNILGNDGIGTAGDAFDSRIVMNVIAPKLGLGSEYKSLGKLLPAPLWIYQRLSTWHHISFLKDKQTMGMLAQVRTSSLEPQKLDALLHIIKHDLGYKLYRSVEKAKLELSDQEMSEFFFQDLPIKIRENVRRHHFETWIQQEISKIESCVNKLLERCNVIPREVDSVFLTGGSAFVPVVRRLFEQKFGVDRLRGGEELTTVARGLALRALDT